MSDEREIICICVLIDKTPTFVSIGEWRELRKWPLLKDNRYRSDEPLTVGQMKGMYAQYTYERIG